MCAPQNRFDPGLQLHDAERFDDIIVGAAFQSGHPIDLRAARRQHNHGKLLRCFAGPQPVQNLQPVHSGQHNIQNAERGTYAPVLRFKQRLAGLVSVHLVADRLKIVAEHFADALIVLHNDNKLWHVWLSSLQVLMRGTAASPVPFVVRPLSRVTFNHITPSLSPQEED